MKTPRSRVKYQPETDKTTLFRQSLLGWYDRNQRVLPWRYKQGALADPYVVWLSEIMLQQTTVVTVIPYFLRFLEKWPTIFALAEADTEELMQEWAGLGYYARARNLHRCAKIIVSEYGGRFPVSHKELLALPGVGIYTSAAIMAIAFGKPAAVVDGNVERVLARVHGLSGDNKSIKKQVKVLSGGYYHDFIGRPGDLAQAFMDLGATVCMPKSPKCFECPIRSFCRSCVEGKIFSPSTSTQTKPKKETRRGFVYWIQNSEGDVVLHRRPESGLLGGMTGLPTAGWDNRKDTNRELGFIENLDVLELSERVTHTFTHFHLILELKVVKATARLTLPEGYFWCSPSDLQNQRFPKVFEKAYLLCLKDV